jgi:putative restriction endonuclease
MRNASAADRSIWEEFFGRWEMLAEHSVPLESAHVQNDPTRLRLDEGNAPAGPTEVLRETAQRRGQAFFRAAVVAAHDGKCCITGISSPALLRASHIVPWSIEPTLRLDPRNGLCLNALHDAAFDRGLITLTDHFLLRVSKRVKSEVPLAIYKEMFESRANLPINLPERFAPVPEWVEFHRRNIFVA